MKTGNIIYLLGFAATFWACNGNKQQSRVESAPDTVATETDSTLLPAPFASKSVTHNPKVLGWEGGGVPIAPAGFTVSKYAVNLKNPRWTYQGPNGDIFVAESNTKKSEDRITILRDTNKDGVPELQEIFAEKLNKPLGMLILNGYFYIANTDGLYRYPYQTGETRITKKGEKILDLPAGGYNNHWTRNLLVNSAGTKIYISVGSASNVAEHGMDTEKRRANILEINPDGTGEKIYAKGLRNPVGMDWSPGSNELWTAVNERDELGDDLVPDYITSVKPGGFYGWPYSYYGQNADPRMKGEGKDLVAKALVPDVPMGSHTASLGLAFYNKTQFPAKYRNGAFVGQHGSWNRSKLSGYRVAFVPFANGKPSGKPESFLTGFVKDEDNVFGRPVGITVLQDGSMLVCDDSGNTIWKVSVK